MGTIESIFWNPSTCSIHNIPFHPQTTEEDHFTIHSDSYIESTFPSLLPEFYAPRFRKLRSICAMWAFQLVVRCFLGSLHSVCLRFILAYSCLSPYSLSVSLSGANHQNNCFFTPILQDHVLLRHSARQLRSVGSGHALDAKIQVFPSSAMYVLQVLLVFSKWSLVAQHETKCFTYAILLY